MRKHHAAALLDVLAQRADEGRVAPQRLVEVLQDDHVGALEVAQRRPGHVMHLILLVLPEHAQEGLPGPVDHELLALGVLHPQLGQT